MKHLSIVRHGKAEPIEAVGDDFQRKLTAKGKKSLQRLKAPIGRMGVPVGLIVTSPALRAEETAYVLAELIGYQGAILVDADIYDAAPATLLHLLSNMPEDADHILLVGHNPGAAGLVSGLCAGSSMRMNLHMPAGGLAHLQLELYWWQQIRWGCGELQTLLRPKLLDKD